MGCPGRIYGHSSYTRLSSVFNWTRPLGGTWASEDEGATENLQVLYIVVVVRREVDR